jgi:hypothetical protein
MAGRQSKAKPTWASVKAKLASFDRTALLNLVQNLYVAHKENQAFLHARLGLGADLLGPYKRTSIGGSGPTFSDGSRPRFAKPNRRSPITRRRSMIPKACPSSWFSIANRPLDSPKTWVMTMQTTLTRRSACSSRPSGQPTYWPAIHGVGCSPGWTAFGI